MADREVTIRKRHLAESDIRPKATFCTFSNKRQLAAGDNLDQAHIRYSKFSDKY